LRLVAEQADPEARGWWEGERFLFATSLDEEELVRFFLAEYRPTSLVSPWNKGSGFYYENDPGLTPIEQSCAPRLEGLREGIKASRTLLDGIASADRAVREIKAETKSKELTKGQREALKRSDEYKRRLAEAERRFKLCKAGLVPQLPLTWRGPHREWMDVAMVVGDDGTPRFPALLGTGGNDGRLDFTNNYFQRLNEIFDLTHAEGTPREFAREWFKQALFGQPARVLATGVAVGQFAPGGAGGANATNGPEGNTQLNPVDFVLMLEGAVLFRVATSRRLDSRQPSRAAAPFAIGGQAAGYASASESDESARGEQWMPLWSQPLNLAELKRLLGEGRAQLGARTVSEPLDLARAVARLGTARGITAFQRYGYIERNGQSNLAVPLGRFVVLNSSSLQLRCLDDLDAWLPRLRGEARLKGAPARFAMAEHRLAETLLAVTQHPDEPARWQAVLLRIVDIEAVQVTGSGYKAGPVPRLRPEWVKAADDGSSEFRLALACALQCAGFNREGLPINSDSVRRHWLPLDGTRYATSGTGGQTRLQIGSDCVMHGRSGLDDAIALVERRLIEAARRGARRLPLVAAYRAAASPTDISRFIVGEVDADRTMRMARALMALDSSAWVRLPCPARPVAQSELPDDVWLAIRLALLPWPMQDGRRIGTDPALLRRLASGDAAAAVDLARRRLRAAGITTTVRVATVSPEIARRWAAALAFPITRKAASRFVERLDPHSLKETQYER
jgi:CRISPR-associated protein Csx17